jgi:cobalt-zinc-cadmium resistance protein CzcA
VLSAYLLKGGNEHDTILVRLLKRPYLAVLRWATHNEFKTIAVALILFVAAVSLFPYLGTSFIPEMKEGTISPNADRVPNISLDESIQMELAAHRLAKTVPGIKHIVSRLGRGESPVDPAGYNETDAMMQLLQEEQRGGMTQDEISDQIRTKLSTLPGVNIVMAQPISDRVDEMVTGVRADVAVKIFGDDLGRLLQKANEVSRVANGIRGTADIKIDRVTGQQNLNVTIDRQAIARHGLNASEVHDAIEAAVAGKAATEIYEGERRFQAVVRYPEHLRSSIRDIRGILLTGNAGAQIP